MKALKLIPALALIWMISPVVSAQTFKIATLAPEGSDWMVQFRQASEVIKKQTDGRVTFRFYGGGVQGKDSQILRKMRIGQLHGATFTSGSLKSFAPSAELYSLPLTFRSMDEVLHVRSLMDASLRQLLEQKGAINFGFAGAGQAYLMSTQPVTTLADLSSQKTWVQEGDEIAYAAFKALGISPVSMPLTDVLTGLQTELLDSAAVPPVGALVLQLHTKLKYVTDLPLSYVYGALVIDERYFSKMSAGDQAVVRKVFEAVYQEIDHASISSNDRALQALLDQGLQLVRPPDAEIPGWRERVSTSNRLLADKGVVKAALLDEMLAHLKAYRAQSATP